MQRSEEECSQLQELTRRGQVEAKALRDALARKDEEVRDALARKDEEVRDALARKDEEMRAASSSFLQDGSRRDEEAAQLRAGLERCKDEAILSFHASQE